MIRKTAELMLGGDETLIDLDELHKQLVKESADHNMPYEDVTIQLALDEAGDVTGVLASWSL